MLNQELVKLAADYLVEQQRQELLKQAYYNEMEKEAFLAPLLLGAGALYGGARLLGGRYPQIFGRMGGLGRHLTGISGRKMKPWMNQVYGDMLDSKGMKASLGRLQNAYLNDPDNKIPSQQYIGQALLNEPYPKKHPTNYPAAWTEAENKIRNDLALGLRKRLGGNAQNILSPDRAREIVGRSNLADWFDVGSDTGQNYLSGQY